MSENPYKISESAIESPPSSIGAALKRIGPGIVLSASIVGSGELIATTTLGAQVGYVALWIVFFSCVIKPIVQSELGRYTIATAHTGLEGFNRVPPKYFLMAAWALMTLFSLIPIGGMYAGVGQVLHLIFPAIPVTVFVFLLLGLTLAILLGGGYNRIEKLAMWKVGFFTMLTLLAALLLMRQPQYFSWGQLAEGLKFQLPDSGWQTAIAMFGTVGLGAGELVMYPYWCVEKGYARFVGFKNDAPSIQRAKGWIRVMNLDIVVSLVIYTISTMAFYVLGAGILHGMGIIPTANDMISVLSNIYTKTLGEWSLWLFYLGAVATLYGTVFASTAANSRIFADMFHLLGVYNGDDYSQRLKYQRIFTVVISLIAVGSYLLFKSPVKMVILGGIAQSVMLPLVSWATVYLHHKHLPKTLRPSRFISVALWVSAILITVLMGYYVWIKFIF